MEADLVDHAAFQLAHDRQHVVCHAQPPVGEPHARGKHGVGQAPAPHRDPHAPSFQLASESVEATAGHARLVDERAHPVFGVLAPGAGVQLRQIGRHPAAQRRVDHLQAVLLAQPVAGLPPTAQGSLGQAHRPACGQIGRADEDVVVHVGPVGVRGDHVVVPPCGDLLHEAFAEGMRLLRRDGVVRVERLDDVQRQHRAFAGAAALGGFQIVQERGGDRIAVGDVMAGRGRGQPLAVGLGRVGHVGDAFGERGLDLADLDYSHPGLPSGST